MIAELSKLFPSIPLVAEEDSHFVRANNLVSSVVSEVKSKASIGDNHLSDADVLEAIDRGGKDAYTFCNKPATYWVCCILALYDGFSEFHLLRSYCYKLYVVNAPPC